MLSFVSSGSAQAPELSLVPVITGLNEPMQLVHAGDGSKRIFIVEKSGTIRAFEPSSPTAYNALGIFLTVTGISSGGEQGLLSLAFHPNYSSNGFFYVYYNTAGGDLELARYQVSANENIADPSSKVIVLTIPHPGQSNHNGGELHFGTDGYLYLSTGDGGGAGDVPNNAQTTSVLLGKMLRLSVNTSTTAPYYIPAPGNPYSNEVYNKGLRNPFRWSFDRQTQDMWIGDVGQDSWEEINYARADAAIGVNYGWRCYEGNSTYNTAGCGSVDSYLKPAYTYATQNPAAAITGGVVYRGATYPFLQGYYIAADFYSGNFYLVLKNASTPGFTTTVQTALQTGISDFGETEDGEIFAVSLTAGNVSIINATNTALPLRLLSFAGSWQNGTVNLNWKTDAEINVQSFEIEYSTDGTEFIKMGAVAAKNSYSGSSYTFAHQPAQSGNVFYRLKMIDKDQSYTFSDVVSLKINKRTGTYVSPTIIQNGVMNVYVEETYQLIEIINNSGSIIMQQNISGKIGRIDIPVSKLPAGVYFVRLKNNKSVSTHKIIIR
jgi:glucose/arabinose dehydrogenase